MDLDEEGLIHGEINGANAGRRANGEVALLDWDEAGVGPLALEYGYPLIAAFISEELVIDHDSARSFYRGYTDAGGYIDHDRLFDAALFHALRYMWFGDVDRRWARIMHALEHENCLISLASPDQSMPLRSEAQNTAGCEVGPRTDASRARSEPAFWDDLRQSSGYIPGRSANP